MIKYMNYMAKWEHPGTGGRRDAAIYCWYVLGIPVYRRIEFLA